MVVFAYVLSIFFPSSQGSMSFSYFSLTIVSVDDSHLNMHKFAKCLCIVGSNQIIKNRPEVLEMFSFPKFAIFRKWTSSYFFLSLIIYCIILKNSVNLAKTHQAVHRTCAAILWMPAILDTGSQFA